MKKTIWQSPNRIRGCAYDFFRYNDNALKLFETLGVKEWVVFGNGFDLCTSGACRHLLKNNHKLIIIEDAVAPAYGPGKIGSEENKKNYHRRIEAKRSENDEVGKFFGRIR